MTKKYVKATRRQIIDVGDMLRAQWDKDLKDYVNGWNDERVAALTLTTVGIVKGVRMDLGMKKVNKGLEHATKLRETVDWHELRLTEIEERLRKLEARP